jgi:hypothetical protein
MKGGYWEHCNWKYPGREKRSHHWLSFIKICLNCSLLLLPLVPYPDLHCSFHVLSTWGELGIYCVCKRQSMMPAYHHTEHDDSHNYHLMNTYCVSYRFLIFTTNPWYCFHFMDGEPRPMATWLMNNGSELRAQVNTLSTILMTTFLKRIQSWNWTQLCLFVPYPTLTFIWNNQMLSVC